MSKSQFKTGDRVFVIAGDDKGKSGRVLRIDRKKELVFVEGLNLKKKALVRSQENPQGGFSEIEGPIHISNIMNEERYNSRRSSSDNKYWGLAMMIKSSLYEQYKNEVAPKMMSSRGYKNLLQVPKLEKIVINTGVGTSKDREVLQMAVDTLAQITGQRPVVTKSRKNISNFKLRVGMQVGALSLIHI